MPRLIYCGILFLLLVISGCSGFSGKAPILTEPVLITSPQSDSQQVLPSETPVATGIIQAEGLSPDEMATLGSLTQVDDYPLYSMTYFGLYRTGLSDAPLRAALESTADALQFSLPSYFACSLYVTLADPQSLLYGRNFDWEYSPALFLYTDPPDGYASVSIVNIAFIRRWGEEVKELTELSKDEIEDLLLAPFLPIDGMNEYGLVVGMAAVPSSPKPYDGSRETIGSLGIIREMLPEVYEHPNIVFDSVLSSIEFSRNSKDKVLSHIPTLRRKFTKRTETAKPEAEVRWLMGYLRKWALGNMPLKDLRELVEKEVNNG